MREPFPAPTEEAGAQPRTFTVPILYTPETYGPRQPQTLNRAERRKQTARARGKGRRA